MKLLNGYTQNTYAYNEVKYAFVVPVYPYLADWYDEYVSLVITFVTDARCFRLDPAWINNWGMK